MPEIVSYTINEFIKWILTSTFLLLYIEKTAVFTPLYKIKFIKTIKIIAFIETNPFLFMAETQEAM